MNLMKSLWDSVVFLFGGKYPFDRKISHQTSIKIQEKWRDEISVSLKSKNLVQLRQALITADKLLDTALGELFEGENMSLRLRNAKDRFEWDLYDRIWKAHKVRNSLVHDLDYDPSYLILEEAIGDLKSGLVALGIKL